MRPPALVVIVLIGLAVAGCSRTRPIYNVSSAPVPVPSEQLSEAQGSIIKATSEQVSPAEGSIVEAKSGRLSAAQVRDAIIEAATDRGWIVKENDPGRFLLETFIRSHSAMVTVDYSPTTYAITYTDSENLLYNGANIHKNYNEWIRQLQIQIDRRLSEAAFPGKKARPARN
jgi:hypothetical protein